MRQKGCTSFINLVNKVRVRVVDHTVETLFRSRFVNKNDDTTYPAAYVDVFAKNKPVR